MIEQPDDLSRATDIVRTYQRATASLLQRRLKIGYLEADHLLDQLEQSGVITPPDERGHRRVQ